MNRLLLLISALSIGVQGMAQTAHALLRDGDAYYQEGMFVEAEEIYRKSKIALPSLNADFNMGNSLYQQERYEESIESYQAAVQRSSDKLQSSDVYYNMGNAYMGAEDLEQAIDAYKKAILDNPANLDAQYNLVIAKEILKLQQQQEQQKQCDNPNPNEDGEKQEDQEKKEEQKDQEQQEPQDGDQEDQEQQEPQEEQQDSSDIQESEGTPFDSTRLEKQTLDSLDAAKLLEIIKSEEKKVQEKLRKFNTNRKKQDKDW